jgi:RimJ/RimL family protein N-acetyltransferase
LARSVLENAFVRMEPLEERHREGLRRAGADPDLWRFASVNQHNADFDSWMAARLAAQDQDVTFAVILKKSGEIVGSSSFLAWSAPSRRVEIGWTWYAKKCWAGAVNPSCKRLMFAHAFERCGLNRVELKLSALNARSWAAVERLGARYEGVHRAHMVMPDASLRDTVWFSVLKDEWPAVQARLDARLAAFGA